MYIIELIIGTSIGLTIGMTGIGGGVLLMPALTVILSIPASIAVGTASLYSFLTKIYATIEHIRFKNLKYKPCLFFFTRCNDWNYSFFTINFILWL